MNHGNNTAFNLAMLNDPNLAVDFIIDNNPEEVQAHLSGLNLLSVAPQNATVGILKQDVRRISDAETLQEVLTVPYVNENSNYTGGYESELNMGIGMNGMAKTNATNPTRPGFGVNLINGISVLGNAVAQYFVSENQTELAGIQAGAQQDLLDAQQEQLDAQIEAGKTFGIPTSAFIAIIGAMVVLFAVVLLSTRN